jgi:hypothetical protein
VILMKFEYRDGCATTYLRARAALALSENPALALSKNWLRSRYDKRAKIDIIEVEGCKIPVEIELAKINIGLNFTHRGLLSIFLQNFIF